MKTFVMKQIGQVGFMDKPNPRPGPNDAVIQTTRAAKLRGAGLILGVESIPKRQELARAYGADVIIDFPKDDVVDQIMELTDGQGLTLAISAKASSCIPESTGASGWQERQ